MARIVGNLAPEDDYTHPLGPEPNFNESMYFNFFDAAQAIGGFVRIGNRANERYAERTVALFLPDGRVLFDFARPAIEDNDAMDAGGLRFEVCEPSQTLRSVFAGDLLELAEPRELADPRRAYASNPKRAVQLELTHDAVGPMYGSAGGQREGDDAEQQFARAHYEQHMRVTGSIEIEGESLALDGFGLRDHSWGPRTWQAIHGYEWLTMNFGADLGAMLSIVRPDPERVRVGGVVVRGDELDRIAAAELSADYEGNGLYHTAVRARLETRGGQRLEVSGRVLGFIPLRHRRGGRTTHIGEGMTEWRLGDRVGHGLSEFLRQLA